MSMEYGVTKHRTDRTGGEIAAGKAQINYRDLVINLYTAYHSIHDDFSQKFYRKKFTEDRQRKQRNTAPTAPTELVVYGVIGSV